MPSHAEFDTLLGLCESNETYFFCDEVYRELEHFSDPLPSVASHYERGISIGGLSKSYGMPGARIGWLTSRDSTSFLSREKP